MPALTSIYIDGSDMTVEHGTLFPLAGELLSPAQRAAYFRAPSGWSRCPQNYDVYVSQLPDGRRLVLAGIDLPDTPRPNRRPPHYPLTLPRAAIQAFADEIASQLEFVRLAVSEELTPLTHDLRALSNEIYNAAEHAKRDMLSDFKDGATYRLETALATCHMLSIRLDILDVTNGQLLPKKSREISVYRKTDKICRTLRPTAKDRCITIELQGPSSGTVFGPPTFELIPFVVVQNAVKYAPDGDRVDVEVSDQSESVTVTITSLGPRIETAELGAIFERGRRGTAAIASEVSGSGLGLFAAKSLIESEFFGNISVEQDHNSNWINGKLYWRTRFIIRIPRHNVRT